jgi:hypothetical protein
MMAEGTRRQTVLITGTPRSGTTLVCHLLNQLPDTVALNEPMQPRHFNDEPDASVAVL